MKTNFLLFSALIAVTYLQCSQCFLTYPVSNDYLNEFLSALHAAELSKDMDLLDHAIPGEDCLRECRENDRKVCYFNFTLKSYQVLGGSVFRGLIHLRIVNLPFRLKIFLF